jgi:hypothetical protein
MGRLARRSVFPRDDDFANALSSAVNRRVRSAYEAAPSLANRVARHSPDFKPASIVGSAMRRSCSWYWRTPSSLWRSDTA